MEIGKIGFTLNGDWKSDIRYNILCVVRHKNGVYASRVENIDIEPGTDDEVWQLMSYMGKDGKGLVIIPETSTIGYYDENGQLVDTGILASSIDYGAAIVDFVPANEAKNIGSGETFAVLFAKLSAWWTLKISNLKGLAYKDKADWNTDIENKPTSLPASDVASWAKQPNKPSYGYSEITGAPTNVSELTNDQDYQTKDQVTTAISNLVSGSPEALDTLQELATALGDDPNFSTTILNKIGLKADKAILKSVTLAVASWTASGENYICKITDASLVDKSVLKITPASRVDRDKMIEFEFDAVPDLAVGSFTIYAKKKPSQAININYSILS